MTPTLRAELAKHGIEVAERPPHFDHYAEEDRRYSLSLESALSACVERMARSRVPCGRCRGAGQMLRVSCGAKYAGECRACHGSGFIDAPNLRVPTSPAPGPETAKETR